MKAINALYEAHKIAFSPFVFQTAYTLMELGVFDALYAADKASSLEELSASTNVSVYGLRVLLEMAEVSGMVERKEEDSYALTKVGSFVARDEMTRVNLMFTQDV